MIWDSKSLLKIKDIPWLILFGSLWGINELITGEFLSAQGMDHSSLVLSAAAVFILAASRGMINKPGSSSLVGSVAVVFKWVHVAPFYCHLAAIFILGFIFDLFASILLRKKADSTIKQALTGSASAFSNNALFGFIMTYIFRYSYWIVDGNQKMIRHIFIDGGLLVFLSLFLAPLGFKFGLSLEKISSRQPIWALAGSSAGAILVWILGSFAS